MRRVETPASAYTVEISPPAWKQLSYLRQETYQRIRQELEGVASTHGTSSKPFVLVDDALAVYDVDHDQRRVVLREVSRRPPGQGA
jgi:mRNA-degrading endonuclease RelE of RelBE toxin-antitoxin system